MKITEVQAVYPNYRQQLKGWRAGLWQIVVRVDTDAGVSGYGCGGGGLSGVEVVNRHLRELLLGENCDGTDDIERLWDKLYAASLPQAIIRWAPAPCRRTTIRTPCLTTSCGYGVPRDCASWMAPAFPGRSRGMCMPRSSWLPKRPPT